MDITELLVASASGLVGTIFGAYIVLFTEKQRQEHERRLRKIEEMKSVYRTFAISLLKHYKDAESSEIDDEFLEGMIGIALCDEKQDPITKALIVLKDKAMWNDHQKYNLVINDIIPEMRKRLKELSEEDKH